MAMIYYRGKKKPIVALRVENGSMWTHLTVLRFPGSVGRTALTGCLSKEKARLLFSNPTRKATEVALTAP